MKTIEVGAFEAKTQFSRLLRDVASGAVVHIHRRGHWIADLVQPSEPRERRECAINALDRISSRRAGLSMEQIGELRNEGREH